uniref:Uncharacterized protein n=1 Tax=Anabas testudineus TaxID=64144 RepID=A0A3Q1JSC3_ANATE
MTLCYGSACLLVLLGAVTVFGSPVHYVLDNVTQTHDSIANVLELKEPKIGKSHLFTPVISSISTSCQRKEQIQLTKATLDIYSHIFTSILQHEHQDNTPTVLDQLTEPSRAQVESDLTKLQQDMENLKSRLNQVHHQNPNYEEVLKELNRIKVDDPVNQKKALAQFKEVYQAASVVAFRGCGTHR